MSSHNGIDFLCGKVAKVQRLPNGWTRIYSRFDDVSIAPGQEDCLNKITEGHRRMIVLRNGVVLGVFGRPRIRLLQMIQRGASITEEVIECSLPMWPKPQRFKERTERKVALKVAPAGRNWLDSHTGN